MKPAPVALLVVALALPSAASAQIQTRGKTQFGISVFGSVQPPTNGGGGSGFAAGQLSLTQYATTNLEIGGDLQLNGIYSGGGSDGVGGRTPSSWNWSGNVFGRLRYNFVGRSLSVPYISLGAGTTLESQSSADGVDLGAGDAGGGSTRPFEYQAGLGVKRFINEKVSFNFEGDYQGMEMNGASSGAFAFMVGLSIYTGH